MPRKHSLSVICIAQNEADRIRRCIESVVDVADEIIVLDAGSTDGTADICREYTDAVHVTADWPGDGIQKQRALERATCEWVFRIDADEHMSPELQAEIDAVMSRDVIEETMFTVRWATYVFGKYTRYGEAGIRHPKLFLREGAKFTPVVVHARLVHAPGGVGRLRGRLLHDANRSYHHMLQKLLDYACLSADTLAAEGKTASPTRVFIGAWGRFLSSYVWRFGFLDGWRGLVVAVTQGQYGFNKYAALWSRSHPSLPPPL